MKAYWFRRALRVACLCWLLTIPIGWSHGAAHVVVSGDRASRPQQPQAAVDDDGVIHVVYGVGDSIRYVQSKDQAASFSEPVELPKLGVVALGMRRGPRIAVAKDVLCITAIGGDQGKGKDGDVLGCRSTDGGKSWQGPVRVNDVAGAAREGLHGMAAGQDGRLCCVWLDLRHGKTVVMAATSTDGGLHWSENVVVYRSPDGSVCECCHPSVAIGGDSRIHVLWRNSLGGNRDMFVATSRDGGATFGEVVQLDRESWPLDACPMDGGAIAALEDGTFATVWRRDDTVWLQSADATNERSLGEGEQPWIAASDRGPYAVWLKRRGGAVLCLRPGDASPSPLADLANDPVIAAPLSGDGPVVAFWEGRHGQDGHTIAGEVIGR